MRKHSNSAHPRVVAAAALLALFGGMTSTPGQDVKNQTTARELSRVVGQYREADTRLKGAYQELVIAHRQARNTAAGAASSNAALLNPKLKSAVRDQLRRNAAKFEAGLKEQTTAIEKKEAVFKDDQKALLRQVNESIPPALRDVGKDADGETVNEIFGVFDLFAFDECKELPGLKLGASFLDQEAWVAAARALALIGPRHLPRLKKGLQSGNTAAKYAVAVAVTAIGTEADQKDKDFFAELYKMNALLKKTPMDRNEREARQKVLEKALDAIRPNRN